MLFPFIQLHKNTLTAKRIQVTENLALAFLPRTLEPVHPNKCAFMLPGPKGGITIGTRLNNLRGALDFIVNHFSILNLTQ